MATRLAIAIGLVVYVVLTTLVSFFMMARVRKPADYLVAGRGLPFWVLAGTITGTCIGTGVIIGGSGLAYQHGWAGCAYPIGLGLGTLITGLCFAQMRRYKFMTLTEEVACYYEGNRIVTEFSSITLWVSQLCWLTVQIIGGSKVVGVVTGLDPQMVHRHRGLRQSGDFHSRRIESRRLHRRAANDYSIFRLWISHPLVAARIRWTGRLARGGATRILFLFWNGVV